MTARYYMGIDPGLSGAIALIQRGDECPIAFDMPTHEITVGRSKKRQLDMTRIARWFDLNGLRNIGMCAIERVNAMPKQGVTSSFNFGFAAGVVQMAVASQFIPMTLVTPRKWKGTMGLTADKDAARRMASQMYPKAAHLFARKKDDGRAEAVLLARYAMEKC